jgi:predicted PurR-regulated permease PerM
MLLSASGYTKEGTELNEKNRFTLIATLAIVAFIFALYLLKTVTIPILIAVILAYLLDPLIDKLETYKINRSPAILLLTLLTVFVLLIAALILLPAIEGEIKTAINKLPAYIEVFQSEALPKIERMVSKVLPGKAFSLSSIIAEGESALRKAPIDIWKSLLAGMTSTLKGTLSLIISIIGAMIIPLYLYYILRDFDSFKEKIMSIVPPRNRVNVLEKARETDEVLSAFIRGQMMVCLILAILYAIGLSVIGIDLAIVIGFLSGVLFIIPYLGTIIGLLLASTIAYLQFHDLNYLLYVAALYGAVQILEGFIITPKIVGEKVGLHPLAVILSVIIAGELFGFLGILIAVPAAAVLKIFASSAEEQYKQSKFFKA